MEKLDNELDLEDVYKAVEVLKNKARKTPLIKSYYYSKLYNSEIYFKMENMQLTGSFKFRGAYNKLSNLSDTQKANGVIACSAGNHAQGIALSSKLMGIKARIIMPKSAPISKINATKGYGAIVELRGDTFDEAKQECEMIVNKSKETFIHPFDCPYVIAGQATIGLEIINDLSSVDTIIVPVGGGGLIAGVALAIKAINPTIDIIGVQADNVHGMKASFENHKLTYHYQDITLADGCAVAMPGKLNYDIVKRLVTTIISVKEEEIEMAMQNLLQRSKQMIEGSGALSVAALANKEITKYISNKKVVCILTGGNVDLETISKICKR